MASQKDKVLFRKIVGGKIYDTSTAELIHYDRRNYRQLYRTQKGNWFMLYLKTFEGYDIMPMTEDAAKEYLMYADIDTYLEIWGYDGIEEA